MATVPASMPTAVRGIAETITGYIVSELSIKNTDVNEPTPDQNGAVADEQTYDTRTDVRVALWGPDTAPCSAGDEDFVVGGDTLKVDSCEKVGAYEQKVKWVVTAHRFENYP
jgi:hypothetical protein